MLRTNDFQRMFGLVRRGAPSDEISEAAHRIQYRLNPHPGGQMDLNVPRLDGRPVKGIQHKYRETVLLFPAAGQTCHAYCTYCFRWAQFFGIDELKFSGREIDPWLAYLKAHPEVRSVLITGGDPLIMKTSVLRRYIEPLLDPSLEHVRSIRIGTKAPGYWPHRFVTDSDAHDLLRLFEEVRQAGRHLALMAHYSHARELSTAIAEEAIRRIHDAGATMRCQAPLIHHVNDSVDAWVDMWSAQVRLGAIPYYMFVERDTGPKAYFEVPLVRALEIFDRAYRRMSGLGRTVRGPIMSATPGKVHIVGATTVAGQQVLVLKFLQARVPAWVGDLFFAVRDPEATWLSDLRPAFGADRFFFETPERGGDWLDRREGPEDVEVASLV